MDTIITKIYETISIPNHKSLYASECTGSGPSQPAGFLKRKRHLNEGLGSIDCPLASCPPNQSQFLAKRPCHHLQCPFPKNVLIES